MAIQDYIDHAINALPVWFSDDVRSMETIKAYAVLFDRAQSQMEFWHDMTFILNADAGPPDWLNQHGIDRSLRRQDSETNAAFRERIRGFSESLTFPRVLALVQNIVDAEGIVGTVAMLELRRDRAFFGDHLILPATGATFSDGPGVDQVLVTVPDLIGINKLPIINQDKLLFLGMASAGNAGEFLIEGFQDDDFIITNPSAVFEVDATADVNWRKHDVTDNLLEGFAKSYLSRGDRMGDNNAALVVILPFGCTAATQASVQQALLDNTGAGIQAIVECRANP